MAGETVVEQPQDNNTKVDEPVKTDKEVIAEEEAAQAEVSLEINILGWKYICQTSGFLIVADGI